MEVRGVQYAWSPVGDFVCVRQPIYVRVIRRLELTSPAQLSKVNSTAPRVLARIARVPNNVVLELTQEVMQAGLLEPCLVATVMICCGHNID